MYAIVEIQGKQYKASEGAILKVDKLAEDGELQFNTVLLNADGENISIGTPYVSGVTVHAKVLETKKAKKVLIYKYKRRKDYQRKRGHRQIFTYLRIQSITA